MTDFDGDELLIAYKNAVCNSSEDCVFQNNYFYNLFRDADDEDGHIIDDVCFLKNELDSFTRERHLPVSAKTYVDFIFQVAEYTMHNDSEICRKIIDTAFLDATKSQRGYSKYIATQKTNTEEVPF